MEKGEWYLFVFGKQVPYKEIHDKTPTPGP
jgi:hypothetical protein